MRGRSLKNLAVFNFNTDRAEVRKMSDKFYHIGIGNEHGARYAILPGDPDRVEKIASYLENPRFYGRNREYTSWIGTLEGEPVLVMSTGMGGPSTAIAVEELYQSGIRSFLRIGTCGGMAERVKGGELVIATGAIRMEGTSKEYVPIEFPAVANLEIVNALVQGAEKMNIAYHTGVVQCKDSFYGQHRPESMPVGDELISKWNAWLKADCLASEMESAALFIVAQVLKARAGCVLNVLWNQEREKQGLDNPTCHDMTKAIKVSIEAVRRLILESKGS